MCPGYGDNRQLTWLPMGKISRLPGGRTVTRQNRKGAPTRELFPGQPGSVRPEAACALITFSSRSSSSSSLANGRAPLRRVAYNFRSLEDDDATASSSSDEHPRLVLRRPHYLGIMTVPQGLRTVECDFIEVIEYWNSNVIPNLDARNIASWNGTQRLTGNDVQSMALSARHSLLAMSVGFHILHVSQITETEVAPSHSGPVAKLWSTFYRHIGISLEALKKDIGQGDIRKFKHVFTTILHLILLEAFINNSPLWRSHAQGFLSLIRHHGGLETLAASPLAFKRAIQILVISLTLINTTSPSYDQLTDVTNYNLANLNELYEIGPLPICLCPTSLFLDIVRINRLRLKSATTEESTADSTHTICSILRSVDACIPNDWITSNDLPKTKEFSLVTQIFKSAIAVYGGLTCPCEETSHVGTSCDTTIDFHRAKLFHLLEEGILFPVRINSIFWPVLVAGVAAGDKEGTGAEKALVRTYISQGVRDPFLGIPPAESLKILGRFWDSGMAGWDECFYRPYALLVG
ncbi:Phomenoic acid biosynthesis cluster-specific transcriptional regulator-like protein [Cladobotryum mycophilum]|uniref:Phomenoic acid biosynthesis cluster-specific transcriptional regulator-like protein n=1 Tax=Cladobotryum mycophilum TaxID=491253 RepID=A0ABR0SA42_9HYPO